MTTVLDGLPLPPASSRADDRHAVDPMVRRIAEEARVSDGHLDIAGYVHVLPATADRESVHWVSRALYHRYYHRHERRDPAIDPFDRRHECLRRPPAAIEDPVRGRLLREALRGRYVWEPGWSVLGDAEHPGGLTDVERDGLVLCVRPDELRRDRDGWSVRFPAQRPFASVGYFAVTGTAGGHDVHNDLVRCYLNVVADAACEAFAELVGALDHRGIRYTAKVANNAEGFDRPDSAVLYVRREDLREALLAVASVHARHRAAFDSDVPAFTRVVAPGVGLADEPSQDPGPISFGQHRCALIAEALVGVGAQAGADERLSRVVDAIIAAGLDPARLHLRAGSPDYEIGDYDIEWPA